MRKIRAWRVGLAAWCAFATGAMANARQAEPAKPKSQVKAPANNSLGTANAGSTANRIRPRANPGITRIYRLKYTPAREMAEVLRSIKLESAEEGAVYRLTLAADDRTNSIIAQGSSRLHDEAASIISEIDVPAKRLESDLPREFQVRIVWLTNSAAGGEPLKLQEPPKDFAPVVKELERLGFSNLTMSGQFIGRTRADESFGMRGTVEFDRPFTVNIDGKAEKPTASGLAVDIRIQAGGANLAPVGQKSVPKSEAGDRLGPSCQVAANVNAPLGHFVVLGTTPTAQFNSIFVLQVTEAVTIAPASAATSATRQQ